MDKEELKSAFFRESPEKYWDFALLKNAPAFRDAPADSRAKGLQALLVSGYGPAPEDSGAFLGEIPIGTDDFSPDPLSAKVSAEFFAYIGIPEGPVPEGGFPGIVLIHGGGGTAFPYQTLYWVKQGYAVIALDWYNQRPVPPADFDGTVTSPYDFPDEEPVAPPLDKVPLDGGKRQDHVSNVANMVLAHSLLLSWENVNPAKTAFVGLSWGSWYGAMVAARDPRFQGGVEIYCGDVKENASFINGRFHHAAKVPLYWITGTNDLHLSMYSLKRCLEECGNLENHSQVIELPHAHIGFYFASCFRMAANFTRGGTGLPKLSEITQNGSSVSAKILDSGKGILRAVLCYTADTGPEQHKRLWQSIPAVIEGNHISAELPAGAHQFFISAYDEECHSHDLCGSTPPVILPFPGA